MTTSSVGLGTLERSVGPGGDFRVDTLARGIVTTSACGDLMTVDSGNGAETYALVLAECDSIGLPGWDQRAREWREAPEAPPRRRISTYFFGTDAGPDNIGMCGRVLTALLGPSSLDLCKSRKLELGIL